jgi:hypothetical protein
MTGSDTQNNSIYHESLRFCNSNTETTWTNVFCTNTMLGDLDFLWYICYKTVGIAAGYRLGGQGVGVGTPAGARFFLHVVQTSSGTHSASYPMGTGGSFSGRKATGALSRPLTFNKCRSQEYVDLYVHFPTRLHGVVLNQLRTGTTLPYCYYILFFCTRGSAYTQSRLRNIKH